MEAYHQHSMVRLRREVCEKEEGVWETVCVQPVVGIVVAAHL